MLTFPLLLYIKLQMNQKFQSYLRKTILICASVYVRFSLLSLYLLE